MKRELNFEDSAKSSSHLLENLHSANNLPRNHNFQMMKDIILNAAQISPSNTKQKKMRSSSKSKYSPNRLMD